MISAYGSYTGNSTDDRAITGVGFAPDAVIVTCTSTGRDTIFKTTAMPSDNSTRIRNDTALEGNQVQSLDSDGFTLGTDTDVNETAATYEWAAFKNNGQGDFTIFNYTGNGADDRDILGFGFQPCWAMVKGDGANTGSHRFEDAGAGNSQTFYGGGEQTDRIQGFETDGIEAGTDATVNTSARPYYGMAFKEVAGSIISFSFVGTGLDDRSIATPNFQARFVLIKQSAGQLPYWRSEAFDATQSVAIAEAAQTTNHIQAMEATGFQIGTGTPVNQALSTYYAFAIGPNTAIAPLNNYIDAGYTV